MSIVTVSDILVLKSIGLPSPERVHLYCNSSSFGSVDADPSIEKGFPASITAACLGIKINASGAKFFSASSSFESKHPLKHTATRASAIEMF